MHFSGFSTMAGFESSMGRPLDICLKGNSRMPNSAARVWSSQFPFRGHWRQSAGWLERISSSTVRRVAMISGSWVTMSMFSVTGVVQALAMRGEPGPAVRTMQSPQEAQGLRSGL